MGFNAIAAGEPFLFKTHWPDNRIVGGGFLSGFTKLRVSEAWEFIGEGNGVGSRQDLLERIRHYRREKRVDAADPDPEIGCILLRNLFFASPGQEYDGPPDFGKPIVTWKKYDLEAPSGRYVADAFRSMERHARIDVVWSDPDLTLAVGGPTRGLPRLMTPRVGQGAFKGLLLTSYHRRIDIPDRRVDRPSREAIDWHLDEVFLSA